jgi:FAD/FMN-containing dehydrogenase
LEAFRPRRHDLANPFDLAAFKSELLGELILPGQSDYDSARQIHDLTFDRHPTMIVRAAGQGDVARTVTLAAESGMQIAVRAGGHSLAGHSSVDGGIVLDLSRMKGLHIDVERRVAWAQPGLTAMEFTQAAAAHGLATPFGDTGSVGIAGLTLGGGIGWLARKYGLAVDALQAVEIVTADGRLITASEDEHPDLFWAVRGGGGNFGVVTRFQYALYPVGEVLGGALFLPPTREVLRSLVPIAASAPEELTTISFLMRIPPAPFVAPKQVGQLSLVVMFVYAGEPADGQAAIAPFRQVAEPIIDLAMPMPYPGIYQFTAAAEAPGYGVTRSRFLDVLEDDAIDAMLDAMATAPSPMAMVQLRVLGGAMGRVPADATAFVHRDAPIMVAVLDHYEDPSTEDVQVAWTEALHEKLAARSVGVYSNFLGVEGDRRIHEAYPGAAFPRLADIKRRYDPSNLFSLNQNIRPATSIG